MNPILTDDEMMAVNEIVNEIAMLAEITGSDETDKRVIEILNDARNQIKKLADK